MKKATTIRKLITLSLCLMMCLSVFAPASVFAKCSHKNTKLVVLKEVTCTRNGKCVKVCIKCGKNLKTCSVKKCTQTAARSIPMWKAFTRLTRARCATPASWRRSPLTRCWSWHLWAHRC